jgi:hypothetical protein
MKIGGANFCPCVVFTTSCLLRKLLGEMTFGICLPLSFELGTVPPCQPMRDLRN